jgi:hypothetical protein
VPRRRGLRPPLLAAVVRSRVRSAFTAERKNLDGQATRPPVTVQIFNISSLVRDRAEQPSFHVAAEKHLRIEYRNLLAGQVIGPFAYEGDVVVTCYRGAFKLTAGEDVVEMGELDQVVMPVGTRMLIECPTGGTLQVIWTPAHANMTQT